MKLKLFEIRDRGTTLSALAIQPGAPREVHGTLDQINETVAQYRHHLSRCGFEWRDGQHSEPRPILLGDMNGRKAFNVDPYDWGDRTWQAAHVYIEQHFDELADGAVIDVRVILGEATAPAKPDRLYRPGDAS